MNPTLARNKERKYHLELQKVLFHPQNIEPFLIAYIGAYVELLKLVFLFIILRYYSTTVEILFSLMCIFQKLPHVRRIENVSWMAYFTVYRRDK